ncbi:lipid droplet-associated hydrolase-like isoform X3 [Dermacentor albipictus]|uniref:lipid droplet-associated hydrolase-like isoform X3 n=1 Tax=Dermacentor albipictus TaxID=60249 RepID=UPI0038FC13BB
MAQRQVPKVRYEYMTVNSVPTKVMLVGKTDLGPNCQEPLLICIPGNPGIVEYYEDFLTEVYDHFDGRLHVCGLSHAGHDEVVTKHLAPSPKEHWHLYGLYGQVRHKVEFVRSWVTGNRAIFLAGHSIGAYMILQVLEELKELNVKRSFLLFPVIERLSETPNACNLTWDARLLKLLSWLIVLLLTVLPETVKSLLVSWYCQSLPPAIRQRSIKATNVLFKPTVFQIVMDMAHEELQVLGERDDEFIGAHMERLTFYYGCNDGWCPVLFYQEIKETFPNGDITLCALNLKHAFVLDRTAEIAAFVSDRIRNSL